MNRKKFQVGNKKIDILEEDWDYLIILDACRYDYFKKVYKDFFDSGTLKKAISPFTNTIEFLNGVFSGKYLKDVIYVSANTFVNSKSIASYGGLNFEGKKHFFKVIDVWDWGWDDNLGTVHPKTINEVVFIIKKKYPNKKMIVHYVQPHIPYISLKIKSDRKIRYKREKILTLLNYFRKILFKITKNNKVLSLFERIFSVPRWEIMYLKYGRSGIKNAYENDLRIVLKYVKKLIDTLGGKYLIIADHGEMLGEHGKWGHGYKSKECAEVPWFVYNKAL